MGFFFCSNPEKNADRFCLLAVTEQNFSKYFQKMVIFNSVELLINGRQHNKCSDDTFSEGGQK